MDVRFSADTVLTGEEALSLSLSYDADVLKESTASLDGIEDCQRNPDPPSDVELYLLLDNSTSMLLPDPSTTSAFRSDRLEAQDRVALYSYAQAIDQAGYGFSRRGDDAVLSTPEFRDAVVNNSAESLASALDDFDVVVKPDVAEADAKAVTVHLITYGYAVDYDKLSFDARDTRGADGSRRSWRSTPPMRSTAI